MAVAYALIVHPVVVYPYLARKKFLEITEKSEKTAFDDGIYECIREYYEKAE